MSTPTSNIKVVILAAGEGKRMGTGIPKVMNLLRGKPLIEYVVTSVEKAGCGTPIVVVNPRHTLVQDYLGDRAEYVIQTEQLGTGHAVEAARTVLEGRVDQVVVLYGDMPFISSTSIRRLVDFHQKNENPALSLMTTTTPDFKDWRIQFYDCGRVIRNFDGNVVRIVEKKDATQTQLEVRELCTCYFSFNATWLWSNLNKIKNKNAQGEYYLVDLVSLATEQGVSLHTLPIAS